MLFNSLHFALFLPIVFTLYWISPHRFRWMILLLSSYYFYMSWNVKYVVLIVFTTVVSYFAAIMMEKTKSARKKQLILFVSLLLCLSTLFVFKYFNFFFESLSGLLSAFSIPLHPVTLNLLLPVGISFYTFQTLSYVIDVYRGEVKAEPNLGVYATFISFFPQLVAGPIERTQNLLPQIKAEHFFQSERGIYGLKLMVWGYFKKVIVADTIAVYVDKVYGMLPEYHGFSLVLATLFFTLQIYCDFSGYSDIARGTAELLDIDLMRNFASPYFSASVKEFWSRWHISLSTWFRDYVYIPLGGNRGSKIRRYWNLLVTFLVSGLWHGANGTFVAWGGVHALAQIAEYGLRIKAPKTGFSRCLRVLMVFCFVALAWVFFRAESMSDAFYVFLHMLDGATHPVRYLRDGLGVVISVKRLALFCALYFAPLGIVDYWGAKNGGDGIAAIEVWPRVFRWSFYVVIGLIILFFSKKGVATEFVYFQF